MVQHMHVHEHMVQVNQHGIPRLSEPSLPQVGHEAVKVMIGNKVRLLFPNTKAVENISDPQHSSPKSIPTSELPSGPARHATQSVCPKRCALKRLGGLATRTASRVSAVNHLAQFTIEWYHIGYK